MTRKHSKFRDSLGLSFLELLVVVGLLAILAALVFPALMRTVERGRSATCVEQLRHLSLVMSQFRMERNQKMWNSQSVADGGEGSITPAQILFQYKLIQSAKEMRCPSATTAAAKAWMTGGNGSTAYQELIGKQYISYAVNGMAIYQYTPYKNSSVRVERFTYYYGYESKLPLFMDGKAFQLDANSWKPDARFSRLALRHLELCNVVFFDGHVESLNQAEALGLDPYGGTNKAWITDFATQ